MVYSFLADLVVVVHLLFVGFVGFGGFMAFRWPRLVWLHVPVFLYGAAISFFGWVCPLTPLENSLRASAAEAGYSGRFVAHYLLPLIYPEQLFGAFPKGGFIAIGVLVLALNGLIYWRLWRRRP